MLLFLVGLWQLLWTWGLPDYILGPIEILRHFFAALGSAELYDHIGASLMRSLPGFAIGTLLGIALGLAAGIARALDQMLSPVIFLTYPVPKIVMLPLFMLWSGLNMGAGQWQIFRRIVVPNAAPLVFAGMRVSLALSFIVMFATEMINARSGLGHLIRVAENSLRFDLMYVSLLSIAILGYLGDYLLRLTRHRVLAWQEQAA